MRRSHPHGAKADGRVEGAHRQTSADGGTVAGAAPHATAILAPGPQIKPTQAHEYCSRQVSFQNASSFQDWIRGYITISEFNCCYYEK